MDNITLVAFTFKGNMSMTSNILIVTILLQQVFFIITIGYGDQIIVSP